MVHVSVHTFTAVAHTILYNVLYNIDIENTEGIIINQKGIRMVTIGEGSRTKGLGWGRLSWIMKDKLLKLGSIAQDSELTICHVSNNIQ